MKASPALSDACGEPKRSSSPATRILPSSGTVTPARHRMRVDLPAPFAPTRPCTSPRTTPMSTSRRATSPEKCLPRSRISIQASGIPFAPGSPRTALTPAASETIRMVGDELVDVVLGHHDSRDRNGLGLPGFSGRDRVDYRLEHGLALRVSRLPDGRGHVAVLDELNPLRAAIDGDGGHIVASSLPKRRNGALHRLVPTGPNSERLFAPRRVRGGPRLGDGVAFLSLTRHGHLVVCDRKAGLALDSGVEGVAAVDAELPGMESHRQNIRVVAEFAEQVLGRVVAHRHAAGCDDDAWHDLAAPARNGNAGSVGGSQAGADRGAREGKDHDRIDLLHRER